MMQERKLQGRQFQLLIGILLAIFLLTYFKAPLSGQSVGGPCEGCEAIFEYGGKELSPVDTLPEFESHKNKMLITGTVYQQDGTTPVANVIIYAYHTNEKGITLPGETKEVGQEGTGTSGAGQKPTIRDTTAFTPSNQKVTQAEPKLPMYT